MASDKVLRNKAFEISSNSKYDGYQRGITSVVYKFFDKKTGDTITHTGTGLSRNKQLALHKKWKNP